MILMAAVLSVIAVAKAIDAVFGAQHLVVQAERHLADLRAAPFFRESGHSDNDS